MTNLEEKLLEHAGCVKMESVSERGRVWLETRQHDPRDYKSGVRGSNLRLHHRSLCANNITANQNRQAGKRHQHGNFKYRGDTTYLAVISHDCPLQSGCINPCDEIFHMS